MCLVGSNQVCHRWRVHQHFNHRNAPCAVHGLVQALRNNPLQHTRQLNAYLRLLGWREHIHDALDGLHGVTRVQGRKHQMTRFRRSDSRTERFKFSHFSDENDVRVLSKRHAQRRGKPLCGQPNLVLIDNGKLVSVHVVDRVFQRNDVAAERPVW